jgi:hypothetical protein
MLALNSIEVRQRLQAWVYNLFADYLSSSKDFLTLGAGRPRKSRLKPDLSAF